LTNLIGINLSGNEFYGPIPESIGELINLEYLWLDDNLLNDTIPLSICSLDSIKNLSFNLNKLCPPYPECIEQYVGEQDTTNCSTMSITDNLIPITYNLSNPYPNPFNPTTSISFSISQSDIVSLNIYDITGKLITTLINEQLNIGYHSIDWDGTNYSSGMYLVKMESGEYVETQKLLLVK